MSTINQTVDQIEKGIHIYNVAPSKQPELKPGALLHKETFHIITFGIHFFNFCFGPLDYTIGTAFGAARCIYDYKHDNLPKNPPFDDKAHDFGATSSASDKLLYLGSEVAIFSALNWWGLQGVLSCWKGYCLGYDLTQRSISWIQTNETKVEYIAKPVTQILKPIFRGE